MNYLLSYSRKKETFSGELEDLEAILNEPPPSLSEGDDASPAPLPERQEDNVLQSEEPRETTVKDGSASWVSLQGLAAGLGTYEGATIAASALGGAAGGVIAGPVGFSAARGQASGAGAKTGALLIAAGAGIAGYATHVYRQSSFNAVPDAMKGGGTAGHQHVPLLPDQASADSTAHAPNSPAKDAVENHLQGLLEEHTDVALPAPEGSPALLEEDTTSISSAVGHGLELPVQEDPGGPPPSTRPQVLLDQPQGPSIGPPRHVPGVGQPDQAMVSIAHALEAGLAPAPVQSLPISAVTQPQGPTERRLHANAKPTKKSGRGKPSMSVDEARALEKALTEQWWGPRSSKVPSPPASSQSSTTQYEGAVACDDSRRLAGPVGGGRSSALSAVLRAPHHAGTQRVPEAVEARSEGTAVPYELQPAQGGTNGKASDGSIVTARPMPRVPGLIPQDVQEAESASLFRDGCGLSAPIDVPTLSGTCNESGAAEEGCEDQELPISFQPSPGSPKLYVSREAHRLPSFGRSSVHVPLSSPLGGSLPSAISSSGRVKPVAATTDPLGALAHSLQTPQAPQPVGTRPFDGSHGDPQFSNLLSPLGSWKPRRSLSGGRAHKARSPVGQGSNPVTIVSGFSPTTFGAAAPDGLLKTQSKEWELTPLPDTRLPDPPQQPSAQAREPWPGDCAHACEGTPGRLATGQFSEGQGGMLLEQTEATSGTDVHDGTARTAPNVAAAPSALPEEAPFEATATEKLQEKLDVAAPVQSTWLSLWPGASAARPAAPLAPESPAVGSAQLEPPPGAFAQKVPSSDGAKPKPSSGWFQFWEPSRPVERPGDQPSAEQEADEGGRPQGGEGEGAVVNPSREEVSVTAEVGEGKVVGPKARGSPETVRGKAASDGTEGLAVGEEMGCLALGATRAMADGPEEGLPLVHDVLANETNSEGLPLPLDVPAEGAEVGLPLALDATVEKPEGRLPHDARDLHDVHMAEGHDARDLLAEGQAEGLASPSPEVGANSDQSEGKGGDMGVKLQDGLNPQSGDSEGRVVPMGLPSKGERGLSLESKKGAGFGLGLPLTLEFPALASSWLRVPSFSRDGQVAQAGNAKSGPSSVTPGPQCLVDFGPPVVAESGSVADSCPASPPVAVPGNQTSLPQPSRGLAVSLPIVGALLPGFARPEAKKADAAVLATATAAGQELSATGHGPTVSADVSTAGKEEGKVGNLGGGAFLGSGASAALSLPSIPGWVPGFSGKLADPKLHSFHRIEDF